MVFASLPLNDNETIHRYYFVDLKRVKILLFYILNVSVQLILQAIADPRSDALNDSLEKLSV